MLEIVGGIASDAAFDAFLNDWQAILQRRVAQAVAQLAELPMVAGIILAGGVGRGAPWPLSDIDLLLIHTDGTDDVATRAAHDAAVDVQRLALLPEWLAQGWWSGLDAGRLAFSVSEVRAALAVDPTEAAARGLLDDARWYHSVDKGFGGQAVFDRAVSQAASGVGCLADGSALRARDGRATLGCHPPACAGVIAVAQRRCRGG